ncbi:MAG: hypothetical protein V4732_11205 [Pseudomonadota bacterium]
MNKNKMKKISIPLLAVLLSGLASFCSAQEIAFAFDKTLSRSSALDGMARAKMLVHSLARVNVHQSMFLIHTKDITDSTVERLMFYDDSGQLLVNAGAHYSLYSRTDSYSFARDILTANAMLSPYLNYRQHIYFPYLYEGGDQLALQQVKDFLAEYGYQPAYTTYQAQDNYLNKLYQARIASNRPVDIVRLEKVYVKMIMADLIAYNAKAKMLLGYTPRQIILLHENDLAAYCIIGLVDALNEKGFTVVAPEKILSDPVANPYLVGGYSTLGYMQSMTGMPDPRRENLYVLTDVERQKIHGYLTEQGLGDLIPAN